MANLTDTRRIGALVPATNPVVEPDFYRVVPPEITVHFERMWNGTWGSQPGISTESGHRLSMTSAEANEVDYALFGFDVGKMNDDVAPGSQCPVQHWPRRFGLRLHLRHVAQGLPGLRPDDSGDNGGSQRRPIDNRRGLLHRRHAAHGQPQAEHRRPVPQLPLAKPPEAADGGGPVSRC